MSNIIIINGPNLNLLGETEQSQYGSVTFDDLKNNCIKHSKTLKINIEFTYTENINGSIHRIAGVSYANVLGMMPHPERAFESYHCSQDGFKILEDFNA